MALQRENTEYIDFISSTFYPDVDVFLETVLNANTPRMYDDAKKIRDDVLQLEGMFKTKMRQIDETYDNLKEAQRECKELRDTVAKLQSSEVEEKRGAVDEGMLVSDVQVPSSWHLLMALLDRCNEEAAQTANDGALQSLYTELVKGSENMVLCYSDYLKSLDIVPPKGLPIELNTNEVEV